MFVNLRLETSGGTSPIRPASDVEVDRNPSSTQAKHVKFGGLPVFIEGITNVKRRNSMTMRARAASISADIAARYTASPMPIAPPITTPVAPINTASFAASQAALRAFGGGSASANLAALRPQFFAPPSGDPVPAAPNVVTVRFQTGGGDETIGEDEFLPGPFMPQELPKLIFDGENLLAYDPSTGDVLEEWSAVSGNPESTPDDLTEVNFGPIPEGGYTIDPDNSNRHRIL